MVGILLFASICMYDGVGRAADPVPEALAEKILDATGVSGGLIVHVGCGDGRLTAALRASDSYLVHGVDVNPKTIDAARSRLQSLGLCGPAAVDLFDGEHLPYAENLVNLLVAEDLGRVSMDECLRVLAPGGVAYIRSSDSADGRWAKTVKPRPESIDEWTHHLHGPGGNPVAGDREVGPPAHLRWTAGPRWARSHGWTPSVSAMVSAGGRLFTISDETLACIDGTVPSKWFVVARDAFSGVLLWKHPIPKWGSEAFSGTPNSGRGVTVGRFTMPPNAVKRLVAVDDAVYVTLGPNEPVTALDAATGQIKRVYAETAGADEILCCDGRLILSVNPPGSNRSTDSANPIDSAKSATPTEKIWGSAPKKQILAVDIDTGRVLWRKDSFPGIRTTVGQDPLGRLELVTGDGKVLALTTEAIECLAADSGKSLWRAERPALAADAVRRLGYAGMYEYLLAVMVYHDGVVLLAQPEPNTHHTYHTMPGSLYAFDVQDGSLLWKHAYGAWGHCTPPDVFVVGDKVWTHVNAQTEFGSVWGSGFKALDSSTVDYRIQALDLRTGKLCEELSTKEIFNVGHHHRCYRNKITERFLMSCRRGVEFVDLSTGKNYQNHWVRSGCLLGYLPANGLLYVTPHPCGCYLNAKLTGYNALSSAESSSHQKSDSSKTDHQKQVPEPRLRKGPAFGQIGASASSIAKGVDDWPTYRHDARRSGATESTVDTDNMKILWQAELGVQPSALVIASGRVFAAGVDSHTVFSLDAADGQNAWKRTVAARVDSPPTLHRGLAIFGSADGRVHALDAADGTLAWQFDAAPSRRLVTAFEQLESPWPVPGSVLVHGGKCWFAAGRSSYLDGGIHFYALDPTTGKMLHHETVLHADPATGKMPAEPDGHGMTGLLNDIPGTDGTNVFIRQMRLSGSDRPTGPHLYTSGGFLDPSWFNRTYWQAGPARTSGLMVLGRDVAYGVELYSSRSRETVFQPASNAYRLVAIPLKASAAGSGGKPAPGKAKKPRRQGPQILWQQRLGIRVTAMLRAGDTLFVAGSPDIVDPQDPHGAWEGRKGGLLAAFDIADGTKLAEYPLPSPPVWDGMSATGGRLYLGTLDGRILCLGQESSAD